MSLNVCPIATIQASAEQVWAFIAEPAAYARWWDAITDSIIPAGSAQPVQLILAHSYALGCRWGVSIQVMGIDTDRKELNLITSLPLGITIHNHISIRAVDLNTCRVSFG